MSIDNREMVYSSKQKACPHILIVDDEPDIIELLELTLARMGMEVSRLEKYCRKFNLCEVV